MEAFVLAVRNLPRKVIEAFESPDVNAPKVAVIIEKNPYFASYFRELVTKLAKKDQPLALETCVALYGMEKTRDLMAAAGLYRSTTKGSLTSDLTLQSSEWTTYAKRAEAWAETKKLKPPSVAFRLGYALDSIAKNPFFPKGNDSFFENLFRVACLRASVALEVHRKLPKLKKGEWLWKVAFLTALGSAVQASEDPSVIPKLQILDKKNFGWNLRSWYERDVFGFALDERTSNLLSVYDDCPFPGELLTLLLEPHALERIKSPWSQFVAALHLCCQMADAPKKPADTKDPVLARWSGLEIAFLGLSAESLVAIAQAADLR